MTDRDDTERLSPRQALVRLVEGNARFVEGAAEHPDQTTDRRRVLTGAQHPFATVFSCADSRVPPELLFDQGLGDLFVVRSAGQVLDHAILGTLEFGVGELGTPLVLVVGHTACGAVRATVDAVRTHAPASGTDVDTLVEALVPAVEEAEHDGGDDVVGTAVRVHVERVVGTLRDAPVISTALAEGTVAVVGAVYDLDTGRVDVLAA